MNDFYTENMADIMQCSRERGLVREILNAWDAQGLPEDFWGQGVKFAFNRNSGNVFLVNEDYQCAMMNGGALESFYSSPYEGREGFFDDLLVEYPDMHHEDQEWFEDIAKGLNRADELPKESEE